MEQRFFARMNHTRVGNNEEMNAMISFLSFLAVLELLITTGFAGLKTRFVQFHPPHLVLHLYYQTEHPNPKFLPDDSYY
jgi:hypothetical protein